MRAWTGIAAATLGTMMVVAVACQGAAETPGGDSPPDSTTGKAAPAMVEAPAPIESVEVNIAESFPPQYFLAVTSGLPNGCVEFGGYEVTGEGDTVTVTVTNVEPEDQAGIACTMVYGLVETNIGLGSDFEPGVTYTVLVNDKSTSFTAQGQQQAMEVEEPAPIESVVIEKVAAKPPNSTLVIVSGLPDGCHELAGHGLKRDGDTIEVEITNLLELGVPCTEEYRTVETRMPIDGEIEACKVYDVLINDEPRRVQATDPTITCDTTAPVATPVAGGDAGKTEVVLAPVESVQIEYNRGPTEQSELVVAIGLPDACYELDDYGMELGGDTIRVKVTNLRNLRDACAEVYRVEETRIPLGDDIEACKVYAVDVNGEVHTVQAIGPTIRCSAPEPDEAPPQVDKIVEEEVPAPIDGVEVGMTRSLPPGVFLAVTSGLPNGCAEFGAYEVAVDGYQVNVTVTNVQPREEGLMCTTDYRTVDTRIDLGSAFEANSTYTVVVNGVTQATFHTPDGPPSQSGKDTSREIERPFQLRLQETAAIGSEGLTVEFVEVLEDSRCPSDVTCIWEGRARVLVSVAVDGEDLGRHELALRGGQSGPAAAGVAGYMIGVLTLDPYPETTREGESEYVVTLAISEDSGSADDDGATVELTLRAEPVTGQLRTVRFVAELTGGPDNNRDLYCQGSEWQFGDGMGVASMPGCLAWTPSVDIPRRFEESYTYESAGTYEASFSYGPLGPVTATVEVE